MTGVFGMRAAATLALAAATAPPPQVEMNDGLRPQRAHPRAPGGTGAGTERARARLLAKRKANLRIPDTITTTRQMRRQAERRRAKKVRIKPAEAARLNMDRRKGGSA